MIDDILCIYIYIHERTRRRGKGKVANYGSRAGRTKKRDESIPFGVIGTGRGINILNPRSSLRSARIYSDDNCKYIDDTSTSAPQEAIIMQFIL